MDADPEGGQPGAGLEITTAALGRDAEDLRVWLAHPDFTGDTIGVDQGCETGAFDLGDLVAWHAMRPDEDAEDEEPDDVGDLLPRR